MLIVRLLGKVGSNVTGVSDGMIEENELDEGNKPETKREVKPGTEFPEMLKVGICDNVESDLVTEAGEGGIEESNSEEDGMKKESDNKLKIELEVILLAK